MTANAPPPPPPPPPPSPPTPPNQPPSPASSPTTDPARPSSQTSRVSSAQQAEFDWQGAARAFASALDKHSAVIVLGRREHEAAEVALGLARQQARRRRVVLCDLLEDTQPIAALAPSEDAHGIGDVFDHGVSLDKVLRPMEGEDRISILPMGAFVTDPMEIMAHRRWTSLAGEFRDDNSLLIVAVKVTTPDVEALVIQLDGAVLVGDVVPKRIPVPRILGYVRPPQVERRSRTGPQPRKPSRYVVRRGRSVWQTGALVGIGITAVIAAAGLWLASRPYAENDWVPRWLRGRGADASRGSAFLPGMDTSGALPDSGLAIAPHYGMLTAADSAAPAPYGIRLISFNTQAGALLELQRNGTTLRAGTFTPILIRGSPWFRVIAGAYRDSAAAAALLDTLRARGLSDAGRAVIDRYPYALLVERDVPDTEVATRLARFQARGLPVYALLQSDGTARLFAGAFKAPEEAQLLSDAMRASGVRTSLVYRTGRVY